MLTAAPAAPQAAGVGELTNEQIQTVMVEAIKEVRETVTDNVERAIMDADVARMERGPVDMGTTGWEVMRAVHRRLAALRAPSREPEGGAVTRAMESLRFVAKMESSTDRMASVMVANWIIQDIATREEAPAKTKRCCDRTTIGPWCDACKEAPAEAGERQDSVVRVSAVAAGATVEQTYGEWIGGFDPADAFRADLIKVLALRAQPPAREDAQPVSCQSCGGEVQGWVCQGCGMAFCERDGRLIAEHPAPAALREAVEHLRECVKLVPEPGAIERAEAFLAALQAEQKGGA